MLYSERTFKQPLFGILLLFLGTIEVEIQQFNHWLVGINQAVWDNVQLPISCTLVKQKNLKFWFWEFLIWAIAMPNFIKIEDDNVGSLS